MKWAEIEIARDNFYSWDYHICAGIEISILEILVCFTWHLSFPAVPLPDRFIWCQVRWCWHQSGHGWRQRHPLTDAYINSQPSLTTHITLPSSFHSLLLQLLSCHVSSFKQLWWAGKRVFCPNCGVLANRFVAMTRGNYRRAFHKCPFFFGLCCFFGPFYLNIDYTLLCFVLW